MDKVARRLRGTHVCLLQVQCFSSPPPPSASFPLSILVTPHPELLVQPHSLLCVASGTSQPLLTPGTRYF